jgi:hypothetical protein
MSQHSSRPAILHSLLRLDQPLSTLAGLVGHLPWDSDRHWVMLTRGHMVAILERFLQDRLSADDVQHWANLVESREDVGLHEDAETELRELIHELANPVLTQPLTRERVTGWLSRLK